MRASKKTYTKRRKGTKKRNFLKKMKTRRKRVRGGTDGEVNPPPLKIKSGTIQLTRGELEELRRSGDKVKEFNTQSKEEPYKRFDPEDFHNDGSQKTKHPGYIHGFNDGEKGLEKEERNYMRMSQPEDDEYIKNYKMGYADGLNYRINAKAEEEMREDESHE